MRFEYEKKKFFLLVFFRRYLELESRSMDSNFFVDPYPGHLNTESPLLHSDYSI